MSPDAPDYTLLSDVNVIGSVTLDVNVVGSVTINTNITGVESGVVFDVAITSSTVTLDVNVTNASLDVNATIVSSNVTLDVNITNASLTVNIGAPLTTDGNVATAIQESIQIDVNIAASSVTLDVNIASSGVTLDVNIASSSVTLDVSITNATVTLNVNVTNEVLQSKLAKPALVFNGENAYVEVPDSPSLDITSGITIAVWLSSPLGKACCIIDKELDNREIAYYSRLTPDGKVIFGLTLDSSYHELYSTEPIPVNEKVAIFLVYDGSYKKIYINNVEKGSEEATGSILTNDHPLWIGHRRWTTYPEWFNGVFYQVMLYNKALNTTERTQLYNNPQQPPTNGLVLWLNFDEGSGDVAYDRSGNGNHGTIYNAIWVSEQGQVAPLLNVNLTASQITLNINITAQDIDLTVYTPSGLSVVPGATKNDYTYTDGLVAAGGSETIWTDSLTSGKRQIKRVVLILRSDVSDTTWSLDQVNFAISADGSTVISGLISDHIYHLGQGYPYAWLSGRAAGDYVLDPPPPGTFKVPYIRLASAAPSYRGDAVTLDVYTICIVFDMPFEYTSSVEIRLTNNSSVDIRYDGVVEYASYI